MSKASQNSIETVILGTGGVGKSALTLRFMYDEFIEEYEPTKSDAYKKTVQINGKDYKFSIVDTAGQEDYHFLRDSYIRNSQGFFCVFSQDNRLSFESVDDLLDKILRIKNIDEISILLVGNKKDIVDEDPRKREVTHEEATEKAEKYKIQYIETSAKLNFNIDYMFTLVAQQIATKYLVDDSSCKPIKSKKKKKCRIL